MNDSSLATHWLENAVNGLSSDGFLISRQVSLEGQDVVVAHRSRFELSKFGNCETFFVFGDLPTCDVESVHRFSSLAFKHAKKSKRFPLPCGLCEAVYCFSVCVVESLDESTANFVRNTAPTMHWAAAEIPVVYDRSEGKLCFFEKTPVWGCAYYKGFRKQIGKYLDV